VSETREAPPPLQSHLQPPVPGKPSKRETREERQARMKAERDAAKAVKLAELQADADRHTAAARARGLDLELRRRRLHVPGGATIRALDEDLYGGRKGEGRLGDMNINEWARVAVCGIEKVASSELKKLLYRVQGDANWSEEPWFKPGLPSLKKWWEEKKAAAPRSTKAELLEDVSETMVNDAGWTKAVYLRHPFERLVSCYKDKFGRGDRRYSVMMTGNKSTHILTFPEFVHLIATPGSPHQNQHWRPQSTFCGLKKFISRFNFVGNFEHLQAHARILLEGTDLWESYGAWGWGDHNGSMFERNSALHRTSAGEVKGRIRIGGAVASKSYDELLPPGSALRKLAFEYYREDFEMLASLEIPPFDNARYKEDLAHQGGR